ncbi:MAG: glycoside hydrolase family 5 protein [Chloroflexi bacterium]|nr:MAG: glycoside hydrolase family 5 protein [Chloroflexota bacterium]
MPTPIQRSSRILTLLQLALALTLLSACSAAPTPAPTPEPPVDAFTINQRLAHSVNLGNALEAPTEGAWGVTLKEEFFQVISQKGFTAVRLPVRWSAHALKEAPYTIDPEFFKRVDWAVEQAFANNLAIVVNMHHYEEMALDPAGNQARFLAIWQQIAEHYQAYPNALMFEPMNEPNGLLKAKHWNDLVAAVLPVIRATNPTRNLVIGPAEWNGMRALPDLKLPADDQHIIVTFHYYNPFQFTHQGAEWAAGSESWLGTKWGSNAEKQYVEFDFNVVAQWAKDNNRPIFLGEFGAYSKADMDSRVLWTASVAREAEAHNFSWSYWEFCSGFGVYDSATGQWREPLAQALLPAK